MGLFGKADKNRIAELEAKVAQLTAIANSITPEMRDVQKLQSKVAELNKTAAELNVRIKNNNQIIKDLDHKILTLKWQISQKQSEIIQLDEEITMQEFGLYSPVYEFATSEQYKDKLKNIRQEQKKSIKEKTAASYPGNFTLDGSLAKGQAIVNDNVKQILRSFNNECDVLINNVKFNTVEKTKEKIKKSYEQLNKMNARMKVSLNQYYLRLKLNELNLAYEYAVKKQEEKEAQKEERARLREEARIQKEIEAARKEAEKERSHYDNALATVEEQLSIDPDNEELKNKKAEIEKRLDVINHNIADIDYRETNKRAGYVYVISNIGSFGENVYKIGMTRRLEPMDRVHELGDASVPFNFDVHAMIFSDDAPKLEAALHHAFEDKKVNMVNTRREFFHVSLDEIEEVVKANYDKTVDFKKIPEAEQFRESKLLRREQG